MTFSLTLDRQGKFPLYQQIVEHIKTQISDGTLPAGTRLPTIRQFASTLGVTRLTVQNAYNELKTGQWVESVVGRGTFVNPAVQATLIKTIDPQHLNSDNVIHDILEISRMVGVRSMAVADPDPTLFPADEFWGWLIRLRPQAKSLLSYGSIQGDPALRVELAIMLGERGIEATPDDIVVTSGAMQGLALIAQTLTQPGDTVIIEQPTFMGFLNVLNAYNLQPAIVPLDDEGPRLEVLERILERQQPRFYYAIPNFHNPTGICMSPQRRRNLLTLAQQYKLIIVEDDIYGQLAYDTPVGPLKTQDTNEQVIYLSGFSKDLMPGLRVGYSVVPPELRMRLLTLRRASDLSSATIVHRALAEFLHDGGHKRHLRRVLPQYRERRDALLQALQSNMPRSVRWTIPQGGFCSWLTLPRYFAPGELYHTALRHGFAFAPGEAFLVRPTREEQFRLCFGWQNPTAIRAGVEMLSELIRARIALNQQQGYGAHYWMPLA